MDNKCPLNTTAHTRLLNHPPYKMQYARGRYVQWISITNIDSRIRAVRNARGMTAQKPASLVGISEDSLLHVESGSSIPTIKRYTTFLSHWTYRDHQSAPEPEHVNRKSATPLPVNGKGVAQLILVLSSVHLPFGVFVQIAAQLLFEKLYLFQLSQHLSIQKAEGATSVVGIP